MKKFGIVILCCLVASCKKVSKDVKTVGLDTVSISTFNYEQLSSFLTPDETTTYVINFWATWCAPCVKELPAFERLHKKYTSKQVKVVLVSLDFPNQVQTKLLPFIEKNQLQSEVVLLDDDEQDVWIPKISEQWSGAIPATLIFNSKKRKFYERSFEYESLETEVNKFLNPQI